MSTLTAQEKDVVERFLQLPLERRRPVMAAMFATDADRWRLFQSDGEKRLHELAARQGLNWDLLDNEQRLDFVNALVHEDRA